MICRFLIQNPRILSLVLLVIVVSGVSSWSVLPQLEDPTLGRRVGVIGVPFPGASAEQIEQSVTIPIEASLNGLNEVGRVRSNSQNDIANIVVELTDEVTNVNPVWTKVRNRLTEIALPADCRKPTLDVVPLKAFAKMIAIRIGNDFAGARQAATSLRQRLQSIHGTEDVLLYGHADEHFAIRILPEKLAQLQLAFPVVAQQLSQQLTALPAASASSGNSRLSLAMREETDANERLKNLRIFYGQGQSIPLDELATIQREPVSPVVSRAMINGAESIVVAAMVDDRRRISEWDDEVQIQLATVRQQFPQIEIRTLFSQREHVEQRLQDLLWNLLMGTLAVVAVVLLLMGWRCMIVVALSLPLSAMLVLSLMRWMGVPIHQMSVTGLIVSLGLLIDNAIVVVDDIRSRSLQGHSISDSIVQAVRHLQLPLLGSTLTTVFAFLPIATLEGPPGEFVGTIAVNVIAAICASFVLSMTIVPALMGLPVLVGRSGFASDGEDMWANGLTVPVLARAYERSLQLMFRVPFLSIVLGCVVPVIGFLALPSLPEQFFPASDRRQIQIEVEQDAGRSLASTTALVKDLQQAVANDPSIKRQNWFIGGSSPTFYYNVVPRRRSTPFYAQAFLDVVDESDLLTTVRRLQAQVDQQFPEARILVRQLEQGPPVDAPVEVRILGDDPKVLREIGSDVRRLMSQVSGVIHTRSDLQDVQSRLRFSVAADAAADFGLTTQQISAQLYTAANGRQIGELFSNGERLPVVTALQLDQKHSLEQLLALPLFSLAKAVGNTNPAENNRWAPVTLRSLATQEVAFGSGAIVRIDGQRTNEVKAYLEAGVLPSSVVDQLKKRLSEIQCPDGYQIQFGGEAEQRQDAVRRLIANSIVLFALMALTLVVTFRSFRCAFMIGVIAALTAGLGPFALTMTRYPFGFMAIVGTMGLIGVAINDSIVVLAAIRADSAAASGERMAMISVVCHSTRHILATTLTTIAGFLPLIISGGRFWPPLAVCVAGGVGGATLLALYVVPSMYLLTMTKTQMTETQMIK